MGSVAALAQNREDLQHALVVGPVAGVKDVDLPLQLIEQRFELHVLVVPRLDRGHHATDSGPAVAPCFDLHQQL
jgi:hypothetical protein